jgi:hypothetical protein
MEITGSQEHRASSTSEHVPATAMRPGPPKGTRPGRTKALKPTPAKRALKLSLEIEVVERLAIHALRRDQTVSEVVADLAVKHLNEWVLHAKPGTRSDVA